MISRTKMTAAAAAAAAVIAAGGGVAAAAGTGGPHRAHAKTPSAAVQAASERQLHHLMSVAVARELNLGAGRVSAALAPIFAVGHADVSSPVLVTAASSLGVSNHHLMAALMHAKFSVGRHLHIKQR